VTRVLQHVYEFKEMLAVVLLFVHWISQPCDREDGEWPIPLALDLSGMCCVL